MMYKRRASMASMYLMIAAILLLWYVAPTHSQTTDAIPSPTAAAMPGLTAEQLQLAKLLHMLMKNDPTLDGRLQGLLHVAEQLPDTTQTDNSGGNPLTNMLLIAISNLAKPKPTSNSTIPGNVTGSQAPGGSDALASILHNPLLQDIVKIISAQIMNGQGNSAANVTDMTSLLALVNPLDVLQTLLMSRPARSVLPNYPQGLISDACYRDVMDSFDALVAMKKWSIDMFDAMGKPNAGIERGSFYFVGSYDECYMIRPQINKGDFIGGVTQSTSRQFGTKFCRANIAIPDTLIESLNVDTHGIRIKLTWGLCVPDTCHSADMEGLFKLEAVKKLPIPVESVYCYDDVTLSNDKSAITAIAVLSVFGVLVFVGTVYDIVKTRTRQESKQKDMVIETKYASISQPVESRSPPTVNGKQGLPLGYMPHCETYEPASSPKTDDVTTKSQEHTDTNGDVVKPIDTNGDVVKPVENPEATEFRRRRKEPFIGRFVQCFSLNTNVPKLLQAKAGPGSVTCVHGIRFLSLTWVVLGHTFNYGIISQDEAFTAGNLLDFVPIMQRFTFQAVVAGGFAVDTFFVLSAFLLTWLQLKETDKKKKKLTVSDVFMYYFHRFWRLTPIYMLVLMTFACLYKYMGSGPFWPSKIWGAEHCKTNWWTNLLYVNNLVGTEAQCMGWSWYLANDMQFYVISPIFLVLMYIVPKFGLFATCTLLATGMSITFWKEHIISGNFFTMKSDGGAYWREVYTVPWCRVTCWAVGMLLGFLVYKRGQKPLRRKPLIWIGWLVATGTALSIVYWPYSENKDGGEPWNNVQRAFYEAFGRPAWGLCVAWVIFACHTGSGGLVNSILSWNGLIPLSRLTYAAYLVHPICMMIYVFSRRTLLHVNDYNVIYLFLGHFGITYMVAFVASLAFEAPAMALEKLLFHRGRSSDKS